MTIEALYLSRIHLNPHSRQVLSELTYPYEMHRTLLRAFASSAEDNVTLRQHCNVLFRVENDNMAGPITLLVQSTKKPDWSFLDNLDRYLWQSGSASAQGCKNILPFLQSFKQEQIFTFRLRANPTRRIARKDDPMKGKRVELALEKDQLAWLVRKGNTGGFEIPAQHSTDTEENTLPVICARAATERKVYGRKRREGKAHRITQAAVLFEGLLKITDAEAFLNTLTTGIGSAKAFGFGLLSLAPAKPLAAFRSKSHEP
jgi:CRISPR system Cascade subunit CasE